MRMPRMKTTRNFSLCHGGGRWDLVARGLEYPGKSEKGLEISVPVFNMTHRLPLRVSPDARGLQTFGCWWMRTTVVTTINGECLFATTRKWIWDGDLAFSRPPTSPMWDATLPYNQNQAMRSERFSIDRSTLSSSSVAAARFARLHPIASELNVVKLSVHTEQYITTMMVMRRTGGMALRVLMLLACAATAYAWGGVFNRLSADMLASLGYGRGGYRHYPYGR
ncbi:hypothetical protein EVAR_100294_1, partial [Eumeta japonica]